MPSLDIDNIKVIYHNKRIKKDVGIVALDNLSAHFENGTFNVVLGYSGCGKTTLLKTIIGLIPISEGKILFDGVDSDYLSMDDKRLSFVSQEYVLYPSMTVFDNIAFPLKTKGCSRQEIIESVYKIADELNLRACLSRKPRDLSGGQQQRVALARAIVKKPSLILLDEPLSNIDHKFRIEERERLKRLVKETQATSIYVTHDFNEALALADRIYVIDKGKLVFEGSVKELLKSSNEVVLSLKESSKDEILFKR